VDLCGDRIGVVPDAHRHAAGARCQDGERAARIAVLGLADGASIGH
jgi:hypothetical protein